MNTIIELLDRPDPCSLLLFVVILNVVGGYMVVTRNDLVVLADQLSVACFIAYGCFAIWRDEPADSNHFLGIAIRALFAGGLGRGASRIVLGIVVGWIFELLKSEPEPYQHVEWEPAPVEQRALIPAPQVVEIVERVRPERKEKTFREKIVDKKTEYQERVSAVAELREAGVIDDEMFQELQANELERFTREVTNVLGYRS